MIPDKKNTNMISYSTFFSGETGFKNMTMHFGWAVHPMVRRICDVPEDVPITFVYGSRSWIDSGVSYEIKYLRNNSYVDVQVC